MRTRSRLIAGVLVAVAAGGAAVALGVAVLLGNIVHLRATAKATLGTGSYLDATINVERTVVDAETGLRGYVITSKPLFLAPTQTAEKQLPTAAAALERAATQERTYVARANAIADAARAYMTSYVPGVIAEVTSDPQAARSVRTTTLGKQLVDGIRLQTQELEQLISARQAARQRAARNSANTAVTVAVVVLIVLTALTLALGGFLGWLLVGRERARERASFLADAGTLLDRGTTAEEVLDTFATLALERGNAYCLGRGAPRPRRAGTRARPGQRRGRDPLAGRIAERRSGLGAGPAHRAQASHDRHAHHGPGVGRRSRARARAHPCCGGARQHRRPRTAGAARTGLARR